MRYFQVISQNSGEVPVESDKNLVPTKCLFGNGLTEAVTNMLINIIKEIGDKYRFLTEEQWREICGQSTHTVFASCNNNLTIYASSDLKDITEYFRNEHFNGNIEVSSDLAAKFSSDGCQLEYRIDDNDVLPVVIGLSVGFVITFFCCLISKICFPYSSQNSSDHQSGGGYNTFLA